MPNASRRFALDASNSVESRRALSRQCSDERVDGPTTTPIHDIEYTPPSILETGVMKSFSVGRGRDRAGPKQLLKVVFSMTPTRLSVFSTLPAKKSANTWRTHGIP